MLAFLIAVGGSATIVRAADRSTLAHGSAPVAGGIRAVALDSDAPENAVGADAFVETFGFNAHFENHYSLYSTSFPRVKDLLVAAGIRHVRVGMVFNNNQHFFDQMKELAAANIHGEYVTDGSYSQAQIVGFPALVMPSLEGFEGPNEPDRQPDPNWAAKCKAFQQHLYGWVKNDARTKSYYVVGPSITSHFDEVGDISQFMDFANTHNYLSVSNPDTIGYGGKTPYGIYGSIQYNLNLVQISSPGKPVISTENGYGATPQGGLTANGRPILDYRAQLRYVPRLFFEQFKHGIVRTYEYEFIDKGGDGTFDRFGVIQTDLTPKPAYYALKSIIGALSDPGPPFTPAPLGFHVSGDARNVQHMLLEKRNGQYVVAIWIETPSWIAHGSGGDIIVPDQDVTLRADKPFSSATLSRMDEQGNFAKSNLTLSNGEVHVPVSDKISLVTLSP